MNQMQLSNEGRIDAIDILKFFAALLITNSHMEGLYPDRFSALVTGGALGDSCFFFCSGFLLMQSRVGDFFNWYKKKVNRIYPTLFAVAILSIVAFGANPTFKSVIISEHSWFVQCIFIFYAAFWIVKRFFSDKLWSVIAIVGLVSLIWFIFFWDKTIPIFLIGTYLRWPLFFCVMLLGAVASRNYHSNPEHGRNLFLIILTFVLLMGLFYGYQILSRKYSVLSDYSIVIAPILFLAVFELYRICSHNLIIRLYKKKGVRPIVFLISALCLEIYLSQWWMFPLGERLIRVFPLNIIICFLLIVIVAYIVKVLSNFLSQTFKSEEYNWKKMLSL